MALFLLIIALLGWLILSLSKDSGYLGQDLLAWLLGVIIVGGALLVLGYLLTT